MDTKKTYKVELMPDKRGVRIWGDRDVFYKLHDDLCECWGDWENDGFTDEEGMSYKGVIAYFSYEVRHAYQGDRHVKKNGRWVDMHDAETCDQFCDENESFDVGVDFTWPQILFSMAAWWECYRHKDCPTSLLWQMREIEAGVDAMLKKVCNSGEYDLMEPYLHGAIYAANPCLRHVFEQVEYDYYRTSRLKRASMKKLASFFKYAVYNSPEYAELYDTLQRNAAKLGCAIHHLHLDPNLYGNK